MNVVLADLSNQAHQASIVELLDVYCRDPFGDGRPLPEQVRQKLIPGLLEHGGARVFLALEREQAVGLAVCLVGFSTFRARPLLNVHDIVVRPEFRGRGFGQALLAAVEAEARHLGACKVTLEVRSDNTVAQRSYRRAGFKPASEPETWFWSRTLD